MMRPFKRVKVLKLIDQFGWAYHFLAKEQQKVSKCIINYIRLQDFNIETVKRYDVFYISSPTISTVRVNAIVNDVRLKCPNVKIIGAYAGETSVKYYDVDVVLAISLKHLPELKELYADKPVLFLPEGIDTDFFIPLMERKCGFEIGYAGREGFPKRTHMLDELAYPVKRQTQHGRAHFLENRSLSPMLEFYHTLGCLVLTSSSECMPRVVLEAMACGLPVISTDVGSLSMVLEPEWLVPINPEALAIEEMNKKLSYLDMNPDIRANVGARNRKVVEEKFSWKVLQPLWDELFKYTFKGRVDNINELGRRVLLGTKPSL